MIQQGDVHRGFVLLARFVVSMCRSTTAKPINNIESGQKIAMDDELSLPSASADGGDGGSSSVKLIVRDVRTYMYSVTPLPPYHTSSLFWEPLTLPHLTATKPLLREALGQLRRS